ncbi:hypothetical protein Sru01_62350 [Sphaerisporangium rufum]|uniref:Uncharacterized protein n=1 Tax=Sphaerisporangium rufum TaxID=1381558 RepID=A0A919V4J2_9ACTN|nr:hypothetical protein [Sphaerisporangium rufum]GII81253.1 hypothetical protein Sru01_62350 [Sphaerisporangium rufum]
MDLSWQTAVSLSCAAIVAAVVPGTIGYTTARLERADRQQAEIMRLRAEVRAARTSGGQAATGCREGGQDSTRGRRPAPEGPPAGWPGRPPALWPPGARTGRSPLTPARR